MTSLSRRLCGREMAHALVKKKGRAKDECYGKLILDLGNEVQSSMEKGTAAMENIVTKLGNTEERAECKKLKKELEEARFSNTLLHMQKEQVERDLYWTRIKAHEFYREMIRTGVVFEERPNEAIDVLESVNADIAAERARQANAGNNASRSGQARGVVELRRWFKKMEMTFEISECAEDKKVKFAATILRGPALTWWNSKVAILGLDVANQIGWNEMEKLMTAEFCPTKELQRLENELWNLKVKEYN
ncbi:putative reverse transcriptase domain-containing protein, partial [Tanacetum coccineum]